MNPKEELLQLVKDQVGIVGMIDESGFNARAADVATEAIRANLKSMILVARDVGILEHGEVDALIEDNGL